MTTYENDNQDDEDQSKVRSIRLERSLEKAANNISCVSKALIKFPTHPVRESVSVDTLSLQSSVESNVRQEDDSPGD